MRKIIQIAQPMIGKEEIDAIVGVLKSGNLTSRFGEGPYAKKFEEAFAKFVNVKYAVAVNSGTAALHMALLAADIGQGDEVIVPSFTFVATAEAVVLCGATPVFADINPQTYCMDPISFQDLIRNKTKAVIPVHMYGNMADMDMIMKIAKEHDLVVIEDAAHAIGAEYDGKKAGSMSDFGCFSFYASKNITTGEGGMVTTNRRDNAEVLTAIRCHGIGKHRSSERIGHNYRMPEINCALGYYQIQKISRILEARRKNANLLTNMLEDIGRLELPKEAPHTKHAWHLYTVRLKGCRAGERNKAVSKLVDAGIQAEVFYETPIHMIPYYRRQFGFYPRSLPKTEAAARQVFSLPSHPGVEDEDIKYISQKLRKIIK